MSYSLPGGAVSGVVRIDDTVHRRPGPRADYVHELLGYFQRAGVTGEASLVRVAPGRRIHDVAHVCWQYLRLGPGAEAAAARRGIRLICDAYRLDGRDEIVEVIMWWQDRCWRGIQAGAEAGDPAMVRLRDEGAVREVRASFGWVAAHRSELEVS